MPRVFADLSPLRESPDYRRLWFGQLISFSGTQLTSVAVPLQVFLITRSSLAVGLTSLAQLIPLIIGSFAGGALADAYDRRKLILWSSYALAATSVGLAVNAGSHPHLWLIVTLSAIAAGFTGVYGPARAAIVPTIVPRHLWPAANALWQILMQTGIVVGPAVAGLLIGAFSIRFVYVVDAITYGAAIIATLRIAPAPPAPVENPVGLWRSATDGFRYLRNAQAVKGTFAADLVAMIFGMPRALFPAIGLVRLHGSARRTVGLLYAAPGAGGLIGAATTGSVGRIHRQGRAVVISILLWGIAVIGFGLSSSLPLAMVCLAIAGAADVWSAVFRNTIMQNFVSDAFRGRLNAIHILVVTGGPRLGDVESGAIAAAIGAQGSVVTGGLACIVGILVVAKLMPTFTNAVATSSVDAV